jgi:hypothetical protein
VTNYEKAPIIPTLKTLLETANKSASKNPEGRVLPYMESEVERETIEEGDFINIAKLKIEVLFRFQRNQRMLFSTGTTDSTAYDYEYTFWEEIEEIKKSPNKDTRDLGEEADSDTNTKDRNLIWEINNSPNFIIHNHPPYNNENQTQEPEDCPSVGDLNVSSKTNRPFDILITKNGFLLYKAQRNISESDPIHNLQPSELKTECIKRGFILKEIPFNSEESRKLMQYIKGVSDEYKI